MKNAGFAGLYSFITDKITGCIYADYHVGKDLSDSKGSLKEELHGDVLENPELEGKENESLLRVLRIVFHYKNRRRYLQNQYLLS